MAASIPQPHVRPDIPMDTWMLGPFDRITVARIVAEIEHKVTMEPLRPHLAAVVAGEIAVLYLVNHACSMAIVGVLHDYGATRTQRPAAAPHLATRAAVRAWATTPMSGAPGAGEAARQLAATLRQRRATCADCGEPIVQPAPGFARWTLALACWRLRQAAGRQRQISAVERLVAREAA